MPDPVAEAATGSADRRRPAPPEVDRKAASAAAVAARRARASVKAAIAARELSPLIVLDHATADPGGVEGRIRVTEFLLSVPAIGTTKMQDALRRLGIAPSKRLGGLGRHQRLRLRDFLIEREERPVRRRNRLVVLAGPTAVGKGTVSAYIRENYPEVLLSVSATTRSPRPGEIDGVNYYFVDDAAFDRMIAAGDLLEHATVHNAYRYGTPRAPIEKALDEGRSVLLEIDLQGARQVRASMPEARLIFLLPPTWEELVRRLVGRGTEGAVEQQRRLETAKVELAAQNEFDHRVVNHTVADAAREVVDLMMLRPAPVRPSTA
ncbi:guanylate kinase [Leifsonia xyli subsp. cynodontis DSM 46306]|jgi:guanylate kinase|uniref:Guanylate kinase n=1 Tax=Leifsonia xyli subsp. cynodontis DSM 46306 TaxID=1389489 RepID=U3P8M3_LEIXC|nr:guanylate kinase [Leifsonia xyli]AGW41282.1 guanylate kinase [Leifsonia xyli subsp. cynodontis DSM 46306]